MNPEPTAPHRDDNPYAAPTLATTTATPPAPTGGYHWYEEDVRGEIARRNRKSLLIGGPGILLQVLAGTGALGEYGGMLSIVGSVLLLVGLGHYARARGQSPWFALLGLLSLLGFIALAILPRRCLICGGKGKGGRCTTCNAPMADRR
ncbi:MAG: hypothetical protein AAGA56_10105 [Myxococcota bacterium]